MKAGGGMTSDQILARLMDGAESTRLSALGRISDTVKTNPAFLVLMLIVTLVNVTLYAMVLNWANAVLKDPRCACANDWRLRYIVCFPPVALLAVLAVAALGSRMSGAAALNAAIAVMLGVAVGWGLLIFSSYRYVNDLVRKGCTCATTNMVGDEALQVYASFKVAWFVVTGLVVASAAYAFGGSRP